MTASAEMPPYVSFVQSRIKWMGELPADLIHASIGILGELIELQASYNRENTLEELGDVEFYCAHYELAWHRYGIEKFSPKGNDYLGGACAYPDALIVAIHSAGELLDYAKKMWVYRKPPGELVRKCEISYATLRAQLSCIHHLLATSPGVLRANNEAKLRTRYPTGYNDAHAQLRLDKQPGE